MSLSKCIFLFALWLSNPVISELCRMYFGMQMVSFLPNKELFTVKHAHQCTTKPARLARDEIFSYNESISSILLSVLYICYLPAGRSV